MILFVVFTLILINSQFDFRYDSLLIQEINVSVALGQDADSFFILFLLSSSDHKVRRKTHMPDVSYIYLISMRKWNRLMHSINGNMDRINDFSSNKITKEFVSSIVDEFKKNKMFKIPKESELTVDSVHSYLKKRHNLVHEFICQCMGIKFGERPIEDFLGPASVHYDRLTPDIVIVKGNEVFLSDVSITAHVDATNKDKLAKYSKFTDIYKDYQFIYYNFIISHEGSFSINSDLISHGCKQIISSHYNKSKRVYNSPRFNELRIIAELGDVVNDVDYDIPAELIKFANNSLDLNIEAMMADKNLTSAYLTNDDRAFLKDISQIKCIEPNDHVTRGDMLSLFEGYKFGSKRYSLISPIPINLKIRPADRSYKKLLSIIKYSHGPIIRSLISFANSKLEEQQVDQTDDTFVGKIASTSIFECDLLKDDLIEIAKEGPNRKKLMKDIRVGLDNLDDEILSKKNNDKEMSDILDYLRIINEYEDSMNVSHFLSMYYSYSEFSDCVSGYLGDEAKYTKRYIKNICSTNMARMFYFVDSVYKHLSFMSSHNRKQGEFKFSIMPHHNTVIILHPGSRLKGEKTLWFKLITSEKYDEKLSYLHQDNVKMTYSGYESRWLSCDISRVDYYSRIMDKFLILNACQIDCLGKNLSKFKESDLNISNLLLLENKSVTSRFVGVLRYFFLKFFSLNSTGMRSLIEEKLLSIPIRTELSLYFFNNLRSYIELYHERRHEFIKPTPISIRDGKIFSNSFQLLNVPSILYNKLVPWRSFVCEWYMYYCFNKNSGQMYHKVRQSMSKTFQYENEAQDILFNKNFERVNGLIDISKLIGEKQMKFSYCGRAVNVSMKLLLKDVPKYIGCLIPMSLRKDVSSLSSMSSSITTVTDKINIFKVNLEETEKKKKIALLNLLPSNRSKVAVELINFIKENKEVRLHYECWRHIMKNPPFPQIGEFPKNQYLSAREIYIMDIKTRICQSGTEAIFRKIAEYCNKEFLSKPNHKVSTQQNHSDFCIKSLSESSYNMTIEETIDNTKWSQNFVCSIFVWLTLPLMEIMPGYTKLMIATFLNMCRKYVEIPKLLLLSWCSNPDRPVEEILKRYKERFLLEGVCSFHNLSHMGQGIFHFVSSVLHCCQCLLRDKIMEIMKMNISVLDMITSDDRKSSIILKADDYRNGLYYKYRNIDFLTRRLMAINQSVEKSSVSNTISEFNSCFVIGNSNCTPTLKWALSSTDNKISESVSSLIQGHYNATRDIKVNGGSSQLCLLSHFINKNYIETLLGTHESGHNDPALILKTSRLEIPYEFGVYPLLQMDTAEFLGPNYASWLSIQRSEKSGSVVKSIYNKLFSNSSDYSIDDTYVGKLDLKFKLGTYRKLKEYKSRTNITREIIDEALLRNPYLIISEPNNNLESQIKCALMLFSSKAHLSFVQKNQVMQFQRISAGKYSNYIKVKGITKSAVSFRLIFEVLASYNYKHTNIIFAEHQLYEIAKEYVSYCPTNYYKGMKGIQKQQDLSRTGYTFINHSYLIHDLVHYFKEHKLTSSLVKSILPLKDMIFIGETLELSAKHYNCKPHQYLNLLVNVVRLQSASKFKICYSGESSSTIRDSLINLRAFPGSERHYTMDVAEYSKGKRLADVLDCTETYSCIFNKTLLSGFYFCASKDPKITDEFIISEVIRDTMDVQCLSTHQKQVLLILLCELHRFDLISNYMTSNKMYLHNWDKLYDDDTKQGEVTIQNGRHILKCRRDLDNIYLYFNSTPNKDYYSLMEACFRMLGSNPFTVISSFYFKGDNKFAIELPKLNIPGYFILSGNTHRYSIDPSLSECYLTADNFEVENDGSRIKIYADKKIISTRKVTCHSHDPIVNDYINVHGYIADERAIYFNNDFTSKFEDVNVEITPINDQIFNKFKESLTSSESLLDSEPEEEIELPTFDFDVQELVSEENFETAPEMDFLLEDLAQNFDFSTYLEENVAKQELLDRERERHKEFMSGYKNTACRVINSSTERTICSYKWNLDRLFIRRINSVLNTCGLDSDVHFCSLYVYFTENSMRMLKHKIKGNFIKSLYSYIQTKPKTYSGSINSGLKVYKALEKEFLIEI